MPHGGEQQVGAAVLGGLGEHLRGCQSGRFVPSRLAAGFCLRAAQCRDDYDVEGADPDVLAGDDEQSTPRRARIVSIEGSEGALRGKDVSAPDRFLQGARGQPSVA